MGKKGKKKKAPPEGPKGAPEWVVTFTDMISLLVTFFVLLMTFSSIRENELLKVDAWLAGTRGLQKNDGMVLPDTPEEDFITATDIERGALKRHSRPPDKLPENLAEMGQKETEEHLELDLKDVSDGLVIEFGAEESFRAGSAVVPRSLYESLAEIGRVLENYPHLVVVEGFTDSSFRPTVEHADKYAMSFARASAAAEVLTRESSISPQLLQISGLGDAHPLGDNDTVDGRRENRRVRIRVLSLSKLRASHLESQFQSLEDER